MKIRDAQRVASRLQRDGFPARVFRDDEAATPCWVYFDQGPWSVHVMRRVKRGQIRVIIDHDCLEVTVFYVKHAGEIAAAVRAAMVLLA